MSPELVIIVLNLIVVLITYIWVYPVFAKRNLNKLMLNDLYAMIVTVSIAYLLFSELDYEFELVITKVNWFWFTITTYLVIEAPFAKRYVKKMGLF